MLKMLKKDIIKRNMGTQIMRGTINNLKTDAMVCQLFSRSTSRWTSYDSPTSDTAPGMDFLASSFSLFIINAFKKSDKM